MSQTYIFFDQAGTIPGIPGMFSHCQVEVEDDGSVNVLSLPQGQQTVVIESSIEPLAEDTQPPALSQPTIEQEAQLQAQATVVQEQQDEVSENNN